VSGGENLFADLEDEEQLKRDGVIKGPEAPAVVPGDQHEADAASKAAMGGHARSRGQLPGKHKCEPCHGTGKISIYRRGGGYGQTPERRTCWKGCGGTGYLKTSPETRAANKLKRQEKKTYKARMLKADASEFLNAHANISRWLSAGKAMGSEFHTSLATGLDKYGSWTPGQLAAARKSTAKWLWKRRAKARDSAVAAVEALDLSPLPAGTYAVPGGDTRLKISVRRPGKNSKWHGWTFVDDGAEYGNRETYGRQRPDGLYDGKVIDQLKVILADPLGALAAYGQLTGTCGACGRLLEDEESVDRGIGPVCYAKILGGVN
jgi:hypothetical protein